MLHVIASDLLSAAGSKAVVVANVVYSVQSSGSGILKVTDCESTIMRLARTYSDHCEGGTYVVAARGTAIVRQFIKKHFIDR
jgi:hypothetical protein